MVVERALVVEAVKAAGDEVVVGESAGAEVVELAAAEVPYLVALLCVNDL